MARTNKKWIAQKKAQLHKQAKLWKWAKKFNYPKRRLSVEEWKTIWVIWSKKNPKNHEYNRFLKWRKNCIETWTSVDPDGFRLINLPSWGLDFVDVPMSWWMRKKLIKSTQHRS